MFHKIIVTDSTSLIAEDIQTLLAEKADLIVVTGGMSVDTDDLIPAGVVAAGVWNKERFT